MRVALVVAMARNRVIGRDNTLPWHLPEDLRHFRGLTLGKPVIMGRRTFESIGKPLPGRTNVVVSSSPGFQAPEGVACVRSIEAALVLAKKVVERDGVDECMVIGGARVYADCLPAANRIYLTLIDAEMEGDTLFPELDPADWREMHRVPGVAESGFPFPFWFVVLERNSIAVGES